MLHCIQNGEKQDKSNLTEQNNNNKISNTTPPPKKKPPQRKQYISSSCNSWAVRVTPVRWGVLILFLTHSSLNAHQAHYEMNLQEFNQRNLLAGIQCLWFLWFGSIEHLPYAAAQCCPQSTTPDSWSIIKPGVPLWTSLEDDNVWQRWPGTNKYAFGANSYQNLTE